MNPRIPGEPDQAMPALLTYAAAAEHLAVTKRTVERAVSAGEIAVIYVTETAPRIEVDELERFVQARRRRRDARTPTPDLTGAPGRGRLKVVAGMGRSAA